MRYSILLDRRLAGDHASLVAGCLLSPFSVSTEHLADQSACHRGLCLLHKALLCFGDCCCHIPLQHFMGFSTCETLRLSSDPGINEDLSAVGTEV